MSNPECNVDSIPMPYREAFRGFAETLCGIAGDKLVGLSAFGGWVVGDPLYRETPARSVAVVTDVDLAALDRLAQEGVKFGKQNVSAPLIMTPEYIRASCDVFPLELLEIQEVHALVCGEDHFADLTFDSEHIRLQCERELKSGLIQLRQGLLTAAGRHKLLADLCRVCAERTVRILRGVARLAGDAAAVKLGGQRVAQSAEATGLSLNTIKGVVDGGAPLDFEGFRRFYGEVESLAAHVDGLSEHPPSGSSGDSKNDAEL